MGNLMRSFWKEEDALGTVEMVLLLAVLVAIALAFSGTLKTWVENALKIIFGDTGAGDGNDTLPTVNKPFG